MKYVLVLHGEKSVYSRVATDTARPSVGKLTTLQHVPQNVQRKSENIRRISWMIVRQRTHHHPKCLNSSVPSSIPIFSNTPFHITHT